MRQARLVLSYRDLSSGDSDYEPECGEGSDGSGDSSEDDDDTTQAPTPKRQKKEKQKKSSGKGKDLYPVTFSYHFRDDGSLSFLISIRGVKYQQNEGVLSADEDVLLLRRPNDRFDFYCLEVLSADSQRIGFVPREFAQLISSLIDENLIHITSASGSSDTQILVISLLADCLKEGERRSSLLTKLDELVAYGDLSSSVAE